MSNTKVSQDFYFYSSRRPSEGKMAPTTTIETVTITRPLKVSHKNFFFSNKISGGSEHLFFTSFKNIRYRKMGCGRLVRVKSYVVKFIIKQHGSKS